MFLCWFCLLVFSFLFFSFFPARAGTFRSICHVYLRVLDNHYLITFYHILVRGKWQVPGYLHLFSLRKSKGLKKREREREFYAPPRSAYYSPFQPRILPKPSPEKSGKQHLLLLAALLSPRNCRLHRQCNTSVLNIKGRCKGLTPLLVANNSNMTDVLQKSIAVTIAFFGTASAVSWRGGIAKLRHTAWIKH